MEKAVTGVRRPTAEKSGVVAASAEDAWALLADWGGLLRWWPKKDTPRPPGLALNLIGCKLLGEPGALPSIREVLPEGGLPVQETLIHRDGDARRIYYTITDDGIPGLQNYVATTFVDTIDANRCRMHFVSTFDVIDSTVDVDMLRGVVESVYESHILFGFNQYFAHL